jgi:predicted adenine nucleotide alpha hydrolase (AANH) superfamily ATPase
MIYPLEQLRKEGIAVGGLFYNPNIHPLAEYKNREQAVRDYAPKLKVEVDFADYAPEDFFRSINCKETTAQRCLICWELRLKATAKAAKEKRFANFTTTLLVSPYQDQESLKKIGSEVAQAEGIDFYYQDFRSGFRQAHNLARAQGIYCQRYCGCIYSEIERAKTSCLFPRRD